MASRWTGRSSGCTMPSASAPSSSSSRTPSSSQRGWLTRVQRPSDEAMPMGMPVSSNTSGGRGPPFSCGSFGASCARSTRSSISDAAQAARSCSRATSRSDQSLAIPSTTLNAPTT